MPSSAELEGRGEKWWDVVMDILGTKRVSWKEPTSKIQSYYGCGLLNKTLPYCAYIPKSVNLSHGFENIIWVPYVIHWKLEPQLWQESTIWDKLMLLYCVSCCTSTCMRSCSHGVYLCSRTDGDGARCRLRAGVFSCALCPGDVSRPSHPQRLRLPDQTTGVLRKTDCGAAGCYWGWRAPRQNGTCTQNLKEPLCNKQSSFSRAGCMFVCSLLIMSRYIWKSPVFVCVSWHHVLTAHINTALNTPIGVFTAWWVKRLWREEDDPRSHERSSQEKER